MGAVLGVLAVLPMLVALSGFMVDDAFVTARYAANVAAGAGYVFNVGDAPTDGVTPLGFCVLLAPFARGASPVLGAFIAAKWLGACAWLVGAAALGAAIARVGGGRFRYAALLLVAASAPLGAWAAAGMETGLVLGLGAVAVAMRALGRERWGLACAGVAAGLRPELIPWAVALALGPTSDGQGLGVEARFLRVVAVLALPGLAALVRGLAFGSALPLSLLAKAPSATLGAAYAGACVLLTGVLAMVAWRRLPSWAKGLELAVVVHVASLVLAGGDWMPLSRLAVPVLPGAFLVAACALSSERPVFGALRVLVALAGELFAASRVGPAAAAVGSKRLRTLAELAPYLEGRVVATVDAGWVGVSAARVVDLAGITDPAVAALPGGHTSKRIPRGLFAARRVDALVMLVSPGKSMEPELIDTHFARWTELHVARLPGVAADFRVVAESTEPHYVVLHRVARE